MRARTGRRLLCGRRIRHLRTAPEEVSWPGQRGKGMGDIMRRPRSSGRKDQNIAMSVDDLKVIVGTRSALVLASGMDRLRGGAKGSTYLERRS